MEEKSSKWFKNINGQWVMTALKHRGELLEAVARSDPSYLQFIYRKKFEDLNNTQYYALEDVLKAAKIPLFEKRKQRLPSKHARHQRQGVL